LTRINDLYAEKIDKIWEAAEKLVVSNLKI